MLHVDRDPRNGEFGNLECPVCHAIGRFRHHGSYRRWVVTLCGGKPRERLTTIYRLRCRSCHSIHSLVPTEIKAKSPYSSSLRDSIVRDHADGALTIAEICEKYGISARTLYRILEKQDDFLL